MKKTTVPNLIARLAVHTKADSSFVIRISFVIPHSSFGF